MQSRLDTAIKNLEIMLEQVPLVFSKTQELFSMLNGDLNDLVALEKDFKEPELPKLPEVDIQTAVKKVKEAYRDLVSETQKSGKTVPQETTAHVKALIEKANKFLANQAKEFVTQFGNTTNSVMGRIARAAETRDLSHLGRSQTTSDSKRAESRPAAPAPVAPTEAEIDATIAQIKKLTQDIAALTLVFLAHPAHKAYELHEKGEKRLTDQEMLMLNSSVTTSFILPVYLKKQEINTLELKFSEQLAKRLKSGINAELAKADAVLAPMSLDSPKAAASSTSVGATGHLRQFPLASSASDVVITINDDAFAPVQSQRLSPTRKS